MRELFRDGDHASNRNAQEISFQSLLGAVGGTGWFRAGDRCPPRSGSCMLARSYSPSIEAKCNLPTFTSESGWPEQKGAGIQAGILRQAET